MENIPTSHLVTAIAAMSGVVTLLWRIHMSQYETLKKQVSKCDEDKDKMWGEIRKLEKMFCGAGACHSRKDLEEKFIL